MRTAMRLATHPPGSVYASGVQRDALSKGRARFALALILSVVAACGLDITGMGASEDAGADAAPLQDATVDKDAWSDSPPDGPSSEDASAARDTGVVQDGGDGPDAADAEAARDAPEAAADAGPCLGVICNDTCLADATDCHACDAGTLLCRGTRACGTTCSGCRDNNDALPIECYKCDATRQNPVGTCEPHDAGGYCLSSLGYQSHCGCQAGVSECPGRQQVCEAVIGFGVPLCVTCGEAFALTSGLACKGGGSCDTDGSTPMCH